MTATTMQAIDGTIANVALPHMQASLSAIWVRSLAVEAGVPEDKIIPKS